MLTHGHFESHLIKLGVTFDHQLLECDKIINGGDLINNLLVKWILAGLGTSLDELFLADTQLSH